jgi:predicted TIM-barrel fold metal-dependent hydrolase
VQRRDFLSVSAASPLAAASAQEPIPAIDTHIHLFDVSRKEGVPWPPKDNAILYKTALPSRFREVSEGLNVVGAIELECSPWVEDNQWVLDVAAKDSIMVGMIGNLDPHSADFPKLLDRFRRNPLYLGIRYGFLWKRDNGRQDNLLEGLKSDAFVANLRLLAQAGLTLDAANPSIQLLEAAVQVSDKVPDLRFMIDHLPSFNPKNSEKPRYASLLKEIGGRKNIYCKLSAVPRRYHPGNIPLDVVPYRDRLDLLCGVFGEDRVVYGSDWPNSDPTATYPELFQIMRVYFSSKTRTQAEKYFWRNSVAAYRWKPRTPDQPRA